MRNGHYSFLGRERKRDHTAFHGGYFGTFEDVEMNVE